MVTRVCLVSSTIWSNSDNAIQDTDFLIDCALTESSADFDLKFLLQLFGIPIKITIGAHGCKVITMYDCHVAPGMKNKQGLEMQFCETHGVEGVAMTLFPDYARVTCPIHTSGLVAT